MCSMKFVWEINVANLFTVIISVIALFFSIKNRKNALRENLYNRQLDVFQNLFDTIIQLELSLEEWVINYDIEDEVWIDENIDDLMDIIDRLDYELSKAQLILPDKMTDEFDKFIIYYNSLEGAVYKRQISEIDLKEFGDKIFDLETAIRDFIGLEQLTKENRKLYKKRAS